MVRVKMMKRSSGAMKGKWREFPTIDSFGVSNNGDLLLVKLIQVPQEHPHAQTGGRIGINVYTFAKGSWEEAEVVESKIEVAKPAFGGIVDGPGPRIRRD